MALLLAALALVGCQSGRIPDPNDPSVSGPLSIDALQSQLDQAAAFLNERKARGEINDARYAELMTQRCGELVPYLDFGKLDDGNAWKYGRVLILAGRWDAARAAFKIAVRRPASEARRVNDTLQLARVEAQLGQVDQAIRTARSVYGCDPEDAAPILPAVVLDIMPAIGDRGDPIEVVGFLEDAIKISERVVVDPNSFGGKAFLIARPHHILRAYGMEIPRLLTAGRSDEAEATLAKYARLRRSLESREMLETGSAPPR